jgi:Spy/CpxP family protein refolding chaperone
MKKTVVMGALALGLIVGGVVVSQAPEALARYSEKKAGKFETRREHRLQKMTENLDLTADQQDKIRSIFGEQHSKMKAIREETHRKILAVLTPEQEEKFKKLREEKKKRE